MDSKKEILYFLHQICDDIESDRLVAKHIAVLISNTDEVLGNGVLLQASPNPPQVTDTMYMCASILYALRDDTLSKYDDDPEVLAGFRSFMSDIERNMKIEGGSSIH